nr:EpsG family protein [Sphingomonas sp. CROZ-RG-20F-R02-07]
MEGILYVVATVLTTLMIGLRLGVGGDWGSYIGIYQEIMFQPLGFALGRTDPGYGFLNWAATRGDLGIWFVNTGSAILFMAGLARLARRQPNPWLAMLVAVPYLIIVVGMGYTRQAAAIGIICWALADASSDRVVRTVVLIGLAALFHKTAILFLPILLAPLASRRPLLAAAGAVAFALMFNVFLGGESDRLVTNYVTSTYDSSGAGVRVAMNVLAAGLLFAFRERLGMTGYRKNIWTICAALAVISVGALLTLSASSGVDRLSLFLIPLQIVVLSRLPSALSRTGRQLPSVLIGVVAYSLTVQFVWLHFADNANAWIPYSTTLYAGNY